MKDPVVTVALISIIPGVLASIIPYFIHKSNKEVKSKLHSINEQIKTNHGKNIGEHVESVHTKLDKLSRQVDALWHIYDTVGSARFGAYLNVSTEAIIIYDLDGKVKSANIKACDLYCLSYKEMIDGLWYESIYEEDRDKFYKEYLDAMESVRSFTIEFRINCKDRPTKTVVCKGHPIYSHLGEVNGYISVTEAV